MFDQITQIDAINENANAIATLLASSNRGKFIIFPVRYRNDTTGFISLYKGMIYKISEKKKKKEECEVYYIDVQEKYYKGSFTCLFPADKVHDIINSDSEV